MPIKLRSFLTAAKAVVPLPDNGSNTISPFRDQDNTWSSAN